MKVSYFTNLLLVTVLSSLTHGLKSSDPVNLNINYANKTLQLDVNSTSSSNLNHRSPKCKSCQRMVETLKLARKEEKP